MEYGTVIMRCRNEKGWTQRDLAQVIRIKTSKICTNLKCICVQCLVTYALCEFGCVLDVNVAVCSTVVYITFLLTIP